MRTSIRRLSFLLPHLTPVSWIDPLENRDSSFIIKQTPNLNKHHCQTLTLRDAFGGLWLCHSNNTSPGTDTRFLFLLGKWSSFFEPIVPSRTTQPSTSNTSKNCLKAKGVLNSNITVVQKLSPLSCLLVIRFYSKSQNASCSCSLYFITCFSQVNGIQRSLIVPTCSQKVKQDLYIKTLYYEVGLQCWGRGRGTWDDSALFSIELPLVPQIRCQAYKAARSMFAEMRTTVTTRRIISQPPWICVCSPSVK